MILWKKGVLIILMAGLLGNAVDWLGTTLRLPEYGLSEALNNGQNTANTTQYQAANYGTPVPQNLTMRQMPWSPNVQPSGGVTTSAQPNRNVLGTGITGGGAPPPSSPPQPTGGGGGNGGGNQSALVQALIRGGYNPVDAQNAAVGPNAQNLMNEYLNAARSGADAELAGLNSQFDQSREMLLSQLGGLDTQRSTSLASLGTEFEGVKKQVDRSKETSKYNTESSISDAGNTAKNTQNKNRNVLRALGILNSSAAGDILSRPMEQFDKERSRLVTLGNQRIQELDDFMNQKTSEHANAVRQIEGQYTQLVGDIQRDLRFNDRQRSDAVRQANAALQQRMAEITAAQKQYEQQVSLQKQNFMQGLAQQAGYQLPQAQLQNILSSAINGQNYMPQNVGIAQDDPRKRLLSGMG